MHKKSLLQREMKSKTFHDLSIKKELDISELTQGDTVHSTQTQQSRKM